MTRGQIYKIDSWKPIQFYNFKIGVDKIRNRTEKYQNPGIVLRRGNSLVICFNHTGIFLPNLNMFRIKFYIRYQNNYMDFTVYNGHKSRNFHIISQIRDD
ncbi:hypothetical protein RF11_04695 [Thelohanellus kitauei]|uniref:Uncharacterized protein n=1 Tax=Thelohanellus kitauei TaxID=669202 RepID=A0A0C2JV65_THEKT|nr:hypothetical protein RF11_04695 [Thelohanellus kitauei]